jgi:hypothetical protein
LKIDRRLKLNIVLNKNLLSSRTIRKDESIPFRRGRKPVNITGETIRPAKTSLDRRTILGSAPWMSAPPGVVFAH